MEIMRFVVAWGLFVSVAMRVSDQKVMALTSAEFPAIYNFGDSNSDTGGIAAAFYPEAAPYGNTFFHRPVGRASDGRLIIDFIAERLGLPYLSAYLDSVGTKFRHGANFATGGATIRRQNESWFQSGLSPFSLDIQVEHYIQFKNRSSYFYYQGNDTSKLPVPWEFGKALYTFDIGQNDMAVGFRNTDQEFLADLPDIVNQFASAVQHLYEEGARTFWIHNTGPIGCLPVSTVNLRNPPPGYLDERGCIKSQNAIAMEFNKQLKDKVVQLRAHLTQASLTYVDIFTAKYSLISNAVSQGFLNSSTICCGRYGEGLRISCGSKGNVNGTEIFGGSCDNPSKVISWDGVHYTEAANFYIANQILNGSFLDPPANFNNAGLI